MSNPVNHNDDLFRQGLEDYREMPSDKVWAGVANALDQDKKKRRFIFWFWTGGLGFAAVAITAAFVLIPVFQSENITISSSELAVNTVEIAQPKKQFTESQIENIAPEAEKLSSQPSTENISSNDVNNKSSEKNITKKPSANTVSQHGKSLNKMNLENVSFKENPRNFNNNERSNSVKSSQESNVVTENSHLVNATASTYRKGDREVELNKVSSEGIKNDFNLQFAFPAVAQKDSTLRFTAFPAGPPPYRFTIGAYGYTGGVAYHRQVNNTPSNQDENSFVQSDSSGGRSKTFGLYAGIAVKGGIIFRSGLYINVGVGYETQRFTNTQQFYIPASGLNTLDGFENVLVNTSFGNASLPIASTDVQANAETLNGKLVYQNHHLFFPIDFGKQFYIKRFVVNIGASAAFHVPISQSAIFYPDQGGSRPVNVNPQSAFNFSVGIEPSIGYTISRHFSVIAGGTFRYHVLNAYRNSASVSRPYILSSHVGIQATF